MNISKVKLLKEHETHYEMHDGQAPFRVPKQGLSEEMHGRIRKMATGGPVLSVDDVIPAAPAAEQLETAVAPTPPTPDPAAVDFADSEAEPVEVQPVTQVHGVLTVPPEPAAAPVEVSAEQKAIQAKADVEKQQAATDAALAGEKIRLAQNQAADLKATAARAHEDSIAGLAKIQGARDEMARIDTSVDTGRWWASRKTEGKVAGFLALALGAFGTGPDGINRAAQQMSAAIDRDIDAQKAEHTFRLQKGQKAIDSATSMYALNHQLLQDDVAATAASHAAAWGLIENKAQLAKAQTGALLAQANADQLIALSAQKKAEYDAMAKNRLAELAIKQQNANTEAFKARTEREALGLKGQANNFVSPGFELAPGAKPRPEELSTWRTTLATKNGLTSQVDDLKSLVSENGTMLVGGNSGSAESIVNDIKSNLKEMEKLGALSGSDYALLAAQIPDPTGVRSLGTKNSTMIAQLDQLKKNLETKFNAHTQALGIKATSGPNSTTSAEDDQARAWAAANPSDPRAAAILKKLGGK